MQPICCSHCPGSSCASVDKNVFIFSVLFLLQFPPSFAAGDVGSSALDLKLSNSVFNTLKQHSYREERQSARLHEKKEHSTHVRQTLLNLRSVVYPGQTCYPE